MREEDGNVSEQFSLDARARGCLAGIAIVGRLAWRLQ
jgi:hypothetical protein